MQPESTPLRLRAASMLTGFRCYREALQQLQGLVANQPAAPQARFALAALDFQLYRDQDALQILTSPPPGGDPTAAAYHNLLGRIRSRQGNSAAAAREFTQATKLDPESDEYWMNLVLELVGAGKTDEARRTLADAQKRLPSSPRLYFARGMWQAVVGHADEAEKLLRQAIDLTWQWDIPFIALGLVLNQNRSAGNFLAPFDEVAALVPQSPWPPLFRALALNSGGPSDANQASTSFRKSLELAGRQPEALPFLLVAALKKKDCGLAREVWSWMETLGFAEDLNPEASCTADESSAGAKLPHWLESSERLSSLDLLAEVAKAAISAPSSSITELP